MKTINIIMDTKTDKHVISKSDSVFNKTTIYMTQFVKKADELLKEYGSAAGAAMRH